MPDSCYNCRFQTAHLLYIILDYPNGHHKPTVTGNDRLYELLEKSGRGDEK